MPMTAASTLVRTPHADPVRLHRDQWVDAQMSQPAIAQNPCGGVLIAPNATTNGVDVSFRVTNATGAATLSLLRATVMDMAQATVLQTWAAIEAEFVWSDTDAVLQQAGAAYYWIKLDPRNVNGSPVIVGPQFILLNPSLVPPVAATAISASHGPAVNGTVLVTCNVAGIPPGESVRITVSGYQGNPNPVTFAQSSSSPLQFTLEATGETVTLTALTVSSGGVASASGPSCTLTLNGAATAAAQLQGVSVTQISTGNQISWPASREAGVTGYQIYRGQRGDAFGAATLLTTVPSSGAGTMLYLDTTGLTGDYQYFVIAVCSTGNSPPSAAANPQIIFSSALIPVNVPANSTNTAYIDSTDAGTSATMRIFGSGGPGTSYTRTMGYGTVTRPGGSVTGLAYTTKYYLYYVSGSYLASTTYSNTLPDGYEWVAVLTTCAHGGTGGGGAGGSGATATAQTGSGFVTGITVTNGGYGYGSADATISGGSGSGATALANCSHGSVVSIVMTNQGAGYTGTPSVTITSTSPYYGGGGNAANGGARYQLVG